MLTARQRVILRQVVQPPYIYRWAGLLTTMALMVGVTIVVLADVSVPTVLATGRTPAAAEHVATPAAASPAPAASSPQDAAAAEAAARPRPEIVASLLSSTATTPDGPTVSLTFDDGPWADGTPAVLDELAQYDAPAVFCMIGQQAVAHPELVQRVVAGGHRLCNHTFTHDPGVADRSPDVQESQLRASRDALAGVLGGSAPVDYFRAPEGHWSPALDRAAAAEGMRPLGWSIDTLDWSRPGVPAIVDKVRQHLQPGSVILFHDGGGPREQTVDALRILLPWMQQQGYRFVLPT